MESDRDRDFLKLLIPPVLTFLLGLVLVWLQGNVRFIENGRLQPGPSLIVLAALIALTTLVLRFHQVRAHRLVLVVLVAAVAGGAVTLAVRGALLPDTAQRAGIAPQFQPLCPAVTEPLPRNAQLASCAWAAFNEKRLPETLELTDLCIAEFNAQAASAQQVLLDEGSPAPPRGTVPQREEQLILTRGPLNDVAACYYARGWALEKLARPAEARAAYLSAMKLPYARVWDSGFFWSPAEAAESRLRNLP